MMSVRSRSLVVLVVMVALAACKKEGGGDTMDLPAEMKPHPAQVDPSRLAVPALFASVPADTPYLVASLEAVPPELWDRMKQAFQPLIAMAAAKWQEQQGKNEVVDAMLSEMDGKWSQAGLESLGLSAQPRFAIYGLGLQPVVVRMAVKDGKAVQATIERVVTKAGKQVTPPMTRDGHSYWQRAVSDDTSLVFSIANNEMVLAFGKTADVEAKLGLILGIDKPAKNMADGALVKQLMARHGFGGQLITFADTRQLVGKVIEAVGATPSPECTGEIDRLSAKLPHLVFGYSELSGSKVAGGMVLEMAPDLVTEMRGLRTEVPGLGAALSGHPMMAFAAGVDLAKAQQLGVAAAGNLQKLGTACGLEPLVAGAAEMVRGLSRPLPDPVGRISGGAIVINDLVFSPGGGRRSGGMPEKFDGTLLIASPDARALFNKVAEMEQMIKSLAITVDGKLHDIHIPIPVPVPLAVGVGDRVIVATAGDKGRAAGDQLVGARSGGKAPLFAATYDFGKLMDFAARTNDMDRTAAMPEFQAVIASMKNVLSRVSGMMDVTDHGLVFWSTAELK
jgi:hypothetical protein